MSKLCLRVDLGRRDYRDVWELQKKLVAARQQGSVPDTLLFVEHPPTYTLGRGGRREHLLVDDATLGRMGASFVQTDRGGDITFHGPGQVVGYPILDLKESPDVHRYLRRLEEVLIRTLATFEIESQRLPGLTGVWHREAKVAAIGVRLSRWVTSHGFALNVATELGYFEHIVPCGIVGKRVASMTSILARPVPLGAVIDSLSREFSQVFDRQVLPMTEAALLEEAHVQVGEAPAS